VLDIVKNRYAELNTITGGSGLNGVIQEEMSIFLEVTVSVIVRIKVHMNMCLILSGYRYSAVLIPRPNPRYIFVWGLGTERSVRKKGGYTRRIARLQFGCCCSHKEMWRSTLANNTRSSHTSCTVRRGWTVVFSNSHCEL